MAPLNVRRMTAAAALVAALAGSSGAGAATLPPLHRGFNTFPWLYRAKTIGNDPQRFDFTNVFPYVNKFTPANFAALHQSGADLIRTPIEPGPLIMAQGAQRVALIQTILAATERVTQLGMTVILDMHPHEGVRGWGSADILASPTLLAAYEEVVVDVARAVVQHGDPRLVLELMNEPNGGYSGREPAYWLDVQKQLVRAVRQVAPTLPIVVSGDRGGGIEGLLRLDPSSFADPLIVYSFHYYDPMVVTHQGASWGGNTVRRYLQHIAYPPTPAAESADLEQLRDRILADASQTDADRMDTARKATDSIEEYYRRAQGVGKIRSDLAQVAAWAKRYNIPASHVLLGEFGVYRPGATVDTVVNYAHDVRSVAEGFGFPWAYYNYTPFDETRMSFSVLQMEGPTPNAFDADIMHKGLGLRVP